MDIQLQRVKQLRTEWLNVKENTVNLGCYISDFGYGYIACLSGHAAKMPCFIKEGFVINVNLPSYNGSLNIENSCTSFFGNFVDLFSPRGGSKYDKNNKFNTEISDWDIAMNRLDRYLEERGHPQKKHTSYESILQAA